MKGKLIVYVGETCAGKTEQLIKTLKRFVYAKKVVQAFKPIADNMQDEICIVSHGGERIISTPISDIDDIFERMLDNIDVIGIDEIQYFSDTEQNEIKIREAINSLLNSGKTIVITGLDMDCNCNPIEITSYLMAKAHEVVKLHGICSECGEEGYVTYYVDKSNYSTSLCLECYSKRNV